MRTTSSVEGLNSVIQRSFPAKTHIFKFVDSLKMFEAIKSTDLYQLSTGEITSEQLERRRAVDKKRDEKIKYFSGKLNIGEISIASFLQAMSSKDILPPVGVYYLLK